MWSGRNAASKKLFDYWLTSEDGRVNWSRVTALVGLGIFVIASTVVLHVYHTIMEDPTNTRDMGEALLFVIGGALGMAGINLGQYLVSKKFPTVSNERSSFSTTTTTRQSGATQTPNLPPTSDAPKVE